MISKRTILLLLSLNLAMLAVVGCLLLGRGDNHPTPVSMSPSQAPVVAQAPVQAHYEFPEDQPVRDSQVLPERATTPPIASPAPRSVVIDRAVQDLVPVAFANPDAASGQWTPETLSALAYLRRQFAQAAAPLGNLDPNSPEYLTRWKEIEDDFDNQYRARLGDEEYLKYKELIDRGQAAVAN